METRRTHAGAVSRPTKAVIPKSKKSNGVRTAFKDLTNGNHHTKRSKTDDGIDPMKIRPLEKSKGPSEAISLECLNLVAQNNIVGIKEDLVDNTKNLSPYDSISVSQYGSDIWSYLNEIEMKLQWPKPNYMSKQKHLNEEMRSILVDWLVMVAEEFNMNEHTIHLGVNYVDRFLSTMSVVREKFQLLGAASMMLAVKVDEVNILQIDEWVYLSGKAFSNHQFTRMEQLILNVLKFELNPPTAITFIEHLCATHRLDKKTLYTAMYIAELVMLEGSSYLEHLPSKIAVAAIVLARYFLRKKDPLYEKLEACSGYGMKQIGPLLTKQYQTFHDSPSKEQQAIQTKYKRDKYHKVASLVPRTLNLSEMI